MITWADAVQKLVDGYWNSDPVSAENPGGFDEATDGSRAGHEENFPAALEAVGVAAQHVGQTAASVDAAAATGIATMQVIGTSIGTAQTDVTTKHNTVVTLAGQVQTAKTAVDNAKGQIDTALAAIAGGPVTSVEGYTGVVASKLAKIDLSNVSDANFRAKETLKAGTATFAAGVLTLDLATGNTFKHTVTANITSFVLANPLSTGMTSVLLRLTNGGAFVVNFSAVTGHAVEASGSVAGIGALSAVGKDDVLFRRDPVGPVVTITVKKDNK